MSVHLIKVEPWSEAFTPPAHFPTFPAGDLAVPLLGQWTEYVSASRLHVEPTALFDASPPIGLTFVERFDGLNAAIYAPGVATPETSTWLMLALGLGALWAIAAKRRAPQRRAFE